MSECECFSPARPLVCFISFSCLPLDLLILLQLINPSNWLCSPSEDARTASVRDLDRVCLSVCLSPSTRVEVAPFQMICASRCKSFTGADSLPAAAERRGLINKFPFYVNVLIGISLPELSFSVSGTEVVVVQS